MTGRILNMILEVAILNVIPHLTKEFEKNFNGFPREVLFLFREGMNFD
jgi:hypothetical protein